MLQQYGNLWAKGYSTVGTSVLLADTYHTNAGVWFAHCLCALEQYYERHGCLPPECHGGFQATSTVLSDSNVKRACCGWLVQQVAGIITPQKFAMAISEIILPSLDITLKGLLGQHTACPVPKGSVYGWPWVSGCCEVLKWAIPPSNAPIWAPHDSLWRARSWAMTAKTSGWGAGDNSPVSWWVLFSCTWFQEIRMVHTCDDSDLISGS